MSRVSTAEAAQIIGVAPSTIRSWIARGALKRGADDKLDLAAVLAAERGRSLAALCVRAGMKTASTRQTAMSDQGE